MSMIVAILLRPNPRTAAVADRGHWSGRDVYIPSNNTSKLVTVYDDCNYAVDDKQWLVTTALAKCCTEATLTLRDIIATEQQHDDNARDNKNFVSYPNGDEAYILSKYPSHNVRYGCFRVSTLPRNSITMNKMRAQQTSWMLNASPGNAAVLAFHHNDNMDPSCGELKQLVQAFQYYLEDCTVFSAILDDDVVL